MKQTCISKKNLLVFIVLRNNSGIENFKNFEHHAEIFPNFESRSSPPNGTYTVPVDIGKYFLLYHLGNRKPPLIIQSL